MSQRLCVCGLQPTMKGNSNRQLQQTRQHFTSFRISFVTNILMSYIYDAAHAVIDFLQGTINWQFTVCTTHLKSFEPASHVNYRFLSDSEKDERPAVPDHQGRRQKSWRENQRISEERRISGISCESTIAESHSSNSFLRVFWEQQMK